MPTINDTWTDFRGRKKLLSEIDHQHLSNIYWFHRIVFGMNMDWVLEISKERFNGQLLSYRPHVDFFQEYEYLKRHDHLRWTPTETEVWFKGVKVGEYLRLPE